MTKIATLLYFSLENFLSHRSLRFSLYYFTKFFENFFLYFCVQFSTLQVCICEKTDVYISYKFSCDLYTRGKDKKPRENFFMAFFFKYRDNKEVKFFSLLDVKKKRKNNRYTRKKKEKKESFGVSSIFIILRRQSRVKSANKAFIRYGVYGTLKIIVKKKKTFYRVCRAHHRTKVKLFVKFGKHFLLNAIFPCCCRFFAIFNNPRSILANMFGFNGYNVMFPIIVSSFLFFCNNSGTGDHAARHFMAFYFRQFSLLSS